MSIYITRRILLAFVVIVGVTLLTFVSIYLAGDPAVLYVSERAGPEELAQARQRLGLDKPLPEQYLNFLGGLLRGDLGTSLANRVPALQLVLERLPATLELTFSALILSNLIAIPIGLISAVKRGTRVDGTIMLVAMLGQSMPGFWLGIMLILFFSVTLRVLPVSGHVPCCSPCSQATYRPESAISRRPCATLFCLLSPFRCSLLRVMHDWFAQRYWKCSRRNM